MLCRKCGKELAEDERVCAQCGEPVAEEIAEETIVEEEVPVFAQPEFDAPVKKPKKKAGLIVAVIAVLLACAIVAGATADPLKGLLIKSFGSDADYLSFVEEKASDELVESVSDAYGTFLENLDKTQEVPAMDMSLQLNVSDKAVDLLENVLSQSGGAAMQFDWLENIALDMKLNPSDKLAQYILGLKLNGKELANADLIMDAEKGAIYAAVLSMSEKYLKVDLDMDMYLHAGELSKSVSPQELKAVFPTEKTVNKLLNKYQQIILAELKTVTKTAETVKLGDIEQKLTALQVTVDGHTAQKLVLAVLEAVREDEDIAKIIKDVAGLLQEKGLISDADAFCKDFADGVADAISEVQKAEPEDADEAIKLITYVNGTHEVVGRKVTDGIEAVSYLTVRDGAKFAFELDVLGKAKLTGEGTENKDVINGEFTLTAKQNLGKLTLTDFCANEEQLNGKITVTPSSELLKLAGLDSSGSAALSLANPELEFVFESNKDSVKMDINLLAGKEMLLGLTLTGAEADASAITTPSSDKVYTQEQAQQWLQGFDFEGLVNKLTDAGVPAELLQGLFG